MNGSLSPMTWFVHTRFANYADKLFEWVRWRFAMLARFASDRVGISNVTCRLQPTQQPLEHLILTGAVRSLPFDLGSLASASHLSGTRTALAPMQPMLNAD